MSHSQQQPDWDRIAEKFDLWLPQLAPVGEAMLDVLRPVAGQRILDVACGTGEPGFSLARQMGDAVELVAVDTAGGMLRAAQNKLRGLGLRNVVMREMAAEKLDFPDNSFDRVLSRFGVMLFESPLAGLKEIRRVLKPGGRFVFAVWSTPETMRTMYWSFVAFKGKVPDEALPALDRVTSLGSGNALEALMDNAGWTEFSIERRTFHYRFPTFADYWNTLLASDIVKNQFDALTKHDAGQIRAEFEQLAKDYVLDEGFIVPHDYLLVVATKSTE